MEYRSEGHIWGMHRVMDPKDVLPQAAYKLDNSLLPFENEILVHVDALQIDSASFRELLSNQRPENKILSIIQERGKMHNPVTNSGGVFLGTVEALGPKHPSFNQLKVGDRIVSLVSLTLTPLSIEKIIRLDETGEKIFVEGHAILFESGMAAKMPNDLPEGVVLAALDVCGAPAQVKRHVKKGDSVLVLGLGKAGKAIAIQALTVEAMVFGIDSNKESVDWCSKNLKGKFETADATNPTAISCWVQDVRDGKLIDCVFHATNVPNTEMSAILPCKDGGKVLFFGMQTSFQKAVLGAEGVGRDVDLLMGNGFVPGHADLMLNLVRTHKGYREWLEKHYG